MTVKRLLIGAGTAIGELSELPPSIRHLIEGADEILVMAPALPSRLEWLTADSAKIRERADERLREVVGELKEIDSEIRGQVGADDPILAFDEAVAAFPPDHILLMLRPDERAGWQESGLVDRIIDRYGLPVTSFKLN